MNFDHVVDRVIEDAPSLIPRWYLMASWAYHVHDSPLLSDGMFDRLCREYLLRWDTLSGHKLTRHVTRGDLECATGHAVRWELVPRHVINHASRMMG